LFVPNKGADFFWHNITFTSIATEELQ
jgi:hypothetical protein